MSVSLIPFGPPSTNALWLARRFPGAAAIAVRVWAESYLFWPRPVHWLFPLLKAQLNLRISKRLRLPTGDRIFFDPFDGVGREILQHGWSEPDTVALFQRLVQPGMVVLDVGAHVGQYTLLASRLVGDRGFVCAFEPDPLNFRELIRNVKRRSNVICRREALGDVSARASLFVGGGLNSGGSSLRATNQWGGAEVPVIIRRLDDCPDLQNVLRVDLIKADVEGAEFLVLQGGARTIARHRPTMIIEFSIHSAHFGYTSQELYSYLVGLDYAVFRVGQLPALPYQTGEEDPTFFNVLAVDATRVEEYASRGLVSTS